MSRADSLARQQEKDQRQVRQHYIHWGVKTIATLIVAIVCGAAWIAWKLLAAG